MKKQKFIIFLLLFVAFSSQAQKNNILKGRAFLIPLNPLVITTGIGLEHLITPHISLQGMYNFFTIEGDNRFGAGSFASSVNREFIPELRYYFGKANNFRTNTFAGIYAIHRKKTADVFFFTGSSSNSNTIVIKDNGIGLLVGQNIPISKRFYFDLYVGGSLERSKKTIGNLPEKAFNHKSPRVGMNFCLLF
jgi:Protein of unknown function (DUF3575)